MPSNTTPLQLNISVVGVREMPALLAHDLLGYKRYIVLRQVRTHDIGRP
jgi:hypothetical protein